MEHAITDESIRAYIEALDQVEVPAPSDDSLDAALYVQGTANIEDEPEISSSTGGAPSLSRRYAMRRGLTSRRPWEKQSTSSPRSGTFRGPGLQSLIGQRTRRTLPDGLHLRLARAQQELWNDTNLRAVEARVSALSAPRMASGTHPYIRSTGRASRSIGSTWWTEFASMYNRNGNEEA
jgi:hypothetical protein